MNTNQDGREAPCPLVKRLRLGGNFYAESSLWFDRELAEAVEDAADEIERLRSELAALREAFLAGCSHAAATVSSERQRMRALIADDASACTYQSMGQYRSALLKALRDQKGQA